MEQQPFPGRVEVLIRPGQGLRDWFGVGLSNRLELETHSITCSLWMLKSETRGVFQPLNEARYWGKHQPLHRFCRVDSSFCFLGRVCHHSGWQKLKFTSPLPGPGD